MCTNGGDQRRGLADDHRESLECTRGGGGTSQTITITITGVNDAATIAGTTTGGATEDTSDAAGTATVTDTDTDQSTFTAVSTETASVSGYGTYTITSGGVWAYTLTDSNSAVQALAVAATMTDTFAAAT